MREPCDPMSDDVPEPPTWFVRAMHLRPRHGDLEVAGVPVHHRAWQGPTGPDVLLVHGAAAHSGWWDPIAPLLGAFRVVAVDLSGHGDSGHRARYEMSGWVNEIVAVTEAAGLRRPVLVGHSMGGRAALTTAVRHPRLARAVVCVDTPLDRRRRSPADPPVPVPSPVFATAEEAVSRFRTRPRTAHVPAWLQEHVVRESLRAVRDGWTWKADQGVFGHGDSVRELLPRVTVPVALLRGEHGLVPSAMAAEMAALTPGGLPLVELPDCGHHPMLEAPLTLLATLRTLLAVWPPQPLGSLTGPVDTPCGSVVA